MKKLLSIMLIIAAVSFTGCFSEYSAIKYNDMIIDTLELSSNSVKKSAEVYLSTVPEKINENTKINLDDLKKSLKETEKNTIYVQKLLKIKSKDKSQEEDVKKALSVYLSASQIYIESYKEMLTYYESAYKSDFSKAGVINTKLHNNYTTFVEANNDLASILKIFYKPS